MSERKKKKVGVPKRAPKRKSAKSQESAPAEKVNEKKATEQTGPAPVASVSSRHAGSMHERRARGYSRGELASGGVALAVAKSLGMRIDLRRRTVLDGNVEKLKGWYRPPQKKVSAEAPKADVEKPAAKKPVRKKAKERGGSSRSSSSSGRGTAGRTPRTRRSTTA